MKRFCVDCEFTSLIWCGALTAKPELMTLPLIRRLKAPITRKRMPYRATVLLGWSSLGRPVSSLPMVTAAAVERRIKLWKRKGYRVSTIVEWDFM